MPRPQVDASSQLRFPHAEFHPSVPIKKQIPHIEPRLITFLHGRDSQIQCDAQRESVIYEQSTSTTTLRMVLEMQPETDVAPNIAAVANSYHLMLSERLQ